MLIYLCFAKFRICNAVLFLAHVPCLVSLFQNTDSFLLAKYHGFHLLEFVNVCSSDIFYPSYYSCLRSFYTVHNFLFRSLGIIYIWRNYKLGKENLYEKLILSNISVMIYLFLCSCKCLLDRIFCQYCKALTMLIELLMVLFL